MTDEREATENERERAGRVEALARTIIETFIRERLPRGSPDGFTAAELARYHFQPY